MTKLLYLFPSITHRLHSDVSIENLRTVFRETFVNMCKELQTAIEELSTIEVYFAKWR